MGQKNRLMPPFLSIIIPVYKAEEFIEACLNSVFSQIPDKVEVILVDDGSPDRSIAIVKSLFSRWLDNGQLVLLEQENMGPGAARNSGLSVARGEYIGFLDSDDVLLDGFFSVIFETLGRHKADVVEFGFQRFNELSDIKQDRYKPLYTFKGLHKLEEVRNEVFSVGTWFPCTRVYKKKLFDEIRFPADVFYEDLMTIPHIYLKDLTVYFIDHPLIGYRFNPNSTTALHNKTHAKDMLSFYMSLQEHDSAIPINILKIKIARSLVYFYSEMGDLGFPITVVLNDIEKIKKQFVLLKNLKLPDLFFFISPKIYMLIDRIRLFRKSKNLI